MWQIIAEEIYINNINRKREKRKSTYIYEKYLNTY